MKRKQASDFRQIMKTSVICLVILLQYHVLPQSVMTAGTMDDIYSLKDKLLSNYHKEQRPVHNLSDVVEINTLFSLFSIVDFDEVSGTATMSCGLTVTWTDFRLSWNSSEFGGIVEHSFSSALVWKPPIVILSSADELEIYGSDIFVVRVTNNGLITFNPGRLVRTTCKVDMTSFPSDSHVCSVAILPWHYRRHEVMLSSTVPEIYLGSFSPSREWEIDRTLVTENKLYSEYTTVIAHDIYLTRKPRYFMISVASPILLLCFLNPFVFLLPVSSGERISFTVTIFLSLAVYMSYIGQELMPNVSDPMSGVSYFLLIAICFSCLLIVMTVLRLRCTGVQNVHELPCWSIFFVRCWAYRRKCSKRNRIEINESSTDDINEDVDDLTTKENESFPHHNRSRKPLSEMRTTVRKNMQMS
ncbi:Neuronal acetylcholine receptor subunit alpha-6 [Mizuhopecten yessoensis]|uniref:Neuronal acetylcholine receptor subunit alpha-6 n=1 Tax=Mizuhopecten yessoensis TaxID=6573 RepID=A0A210Q8D5_MIZYE|nr:Neuronal acetylcholine receptor subunit alpha-6 [Mizuhopecten yessoensis]